MRSNGVGAFNFRATVCEIAENDAPSIHEVIPFVRFIDRGFDEQQAVAGHRLDEAVVFRRGQWIGRSSMVLAGISRRMRKPEKAASGRTPSGPSGSLSSAISRRNGAQKTADLNNFSPPFPDDRRRTAGPNQVEASIPLHPDFRATFRLRTR
jgi:hypothetical protein